MYNVILQSIRIQRNRYKRISICKIKNENLLATAVYDLLRYFFPSKFNSTKIKIYINN